MSNVFNLPHAEGIPEAARRVMFAMQAEPVRKDVLLRQALDALRECSVCVDDFDSVQACEVADHQREVAITALSKELE